MRERTPVTRITAQQSLLNEILSIRRWINLWSRDPDSSLGKQNKNSFLKIVSAIRNFMKTSHGKPETCVLAQSNGQGHTSITSCIFCKYTRANPKIRRLLPYFCFYLINIILSQKLVDIIKQYFTFIWAQKIK